MINSIKKSDFVFDLLCKICAYCGYHLLSVDETTALLRIDTESSTNKEIRYYWAIDSVNYTYEKVIKND